MYTLSLKEVCELLLISPATVRNWIKSKRLFPVENNDSSLFFAKEDILHLHRELQSNSNQQLKSRRNKSHIAGFGLYKGYIQHKPSIQIIQSISDCILKTCAQSHLPQNYLKLILGEYSIRFLIDSGKITLPSHKRNDEHNHQHQRTPLLLAWMQGNLDLGIYGDLIQSFLPQGEPLEKMLLEISPLLDFELHHVYGQDILGLLYLSLKSISIRKETGSYYTPLAAVKTALTSARKHTDFQNKSILDPCCGSGNFLVCLHDFIQTPEMIHGRDIDPVAIFIARINMALTFDIGDISILYKNISQENFLLSPSCQSFDLIVGNPPWGFTFSSEALSLLSAHYQTASEGKAESFSLFLEKSFSICKMHGEIIFVLPEAILSVKAHDNIRKLVQELGQIKSITYLGHIFNQVACPSIILCMQKNDMPFSTKNITIQNPKGSFLIQTQRTNAHHFWNFNYTDEAYVVLKKISQLPNAIYLKNNADFALGIVTGNNQSHILHCPPGSDQEMSDDFEMILKGSHIYKYNYHLSQDFVDYHPKQYQQVAPERFYRAKEKLIYRFIGDSLIFAYDDRQRLTLNSANILIPKIPGVSMKYVLGILNSGVMQYYYSKSYQSVKVLRAYLEALPIPCPTQHEQNKIVAIVEALLASKNETQTQELHQALDTHVMDLFHLDKLP